MKGVVISGCQEKQKHLSSALNVNLLIGTYQEKMDNPTCKCGRHTLKDVSQRKVMHNRELCTCVEKGDDPKQIYFCSGCLKDMNYCNCDEPVGEAF